VSTIINGYEAEPAEVTAIIASLVDEEDRTDPTILYMRATKLLATYTDVLAELKLLRAQAVAAIAADTQSYARTAEHLGLSKPRVQQLVADANATATA